MSEARWEAMQDFLNDCFPDMVADRLDEIVEENLDAIIEILNGMGYRVEKIEGVKEALDK